MTAAANAGTASRIAPVCEPLPPVAGTVVHTAPVVASRPIKCRVCREPAARAWNSLLRVCSLDCAARLGEARLEEKKRRDAIADRKATRAKLVELKPLPWHKARTQEACNAYVRLRDAGKPCICCGKPTDGELVDAGHYLARGSAPELRYDLDNIHLQLRGCNRGRTPVPRARFQAQMLERIGPERLAALEGPHPTRKWTREELIALRARFVAMAKEVDSVCRPDPNSAVA